LTLLFHTGAPRVHAQTAAVTPSATALPTVPDEPAPPAVAAAPDPGAEAPYVIQSNDQLSIFVWKEPNLSSKVLVRPDGRISFPLVQDMQAAGLNPGELKQKIEESLKQFIEIPNVTVVVDAIAVQSYRVYVTGKVGKPGAIVVEKPLSVLQALALAGGFTEFANPAEMVIVRSNVAETQRLRFNYRDVIKGKNADQNLQLQAGDVVVVP
jgi:polysaccharide export outer membrane protein